MGEVRISSCDMVCDMITPVNKYIDLKGNHEGYPYGFVEDVLISVGAIPCGCPLDID
jgi:hypothetical protein